MKFALKSGFPRELEASKFQNFSSISAATVVPPAVATITLARPDVKI